MEKLICKESADESIFKVGNSYKTGVIENERTIISEDGDTYMLLDIVRHFKFIAETKGEKK